MEQYITSRMMAFRTDQTDRNPLTPIAYLILGRLRARLLKSRNITPRDSSSLMKNAKLIQLLHHQLVKRNKKSIEN